METTVTKNIEGFAILVDEQQLSLKLADFICDEGNFTVISLDINYQAKISVIRFKRTSRTARLTDTEVFAKMEWLINIFNLKNLS